MEKNQVSKGEEKRFPLIFEDHISELRHRMLDAIVWFGALVGTPLIVHVCFRYFIYQGMVWEVFVQIAVYSSFWIFLVFKSKIDFRIRAGFILLGLMLSAFIGFIRFGVFSFAPVTLFVCVVISGLLLGRKPALFTGLTVLVLNVLVAILFQKGILSYPFPTESYANRAIVWTGWILALIAYLVVTLVCHDLIYRFLKKKIAESEDYRSEIIAQNERLLEQTRALEEAKLSLEKAIRVKDEFLGMMSHELRGPIGPIIGVTQLLDDDFEHDSGKREHLQVIRSSAEQLQHSIDQILNMTSINSASMTNQPSWVSIRSILEKLQGEFDPMFKEKGISLALLMDPSDPHEYFLDQDKLIEVLEQLLSNALKFSRAGHVTLECVQQKSPETDFKELGFVVKDEGIGMPPERFDVIQDVFTQLDAGTGRAFNGLGLGLSIVARLAAMMDARLVFESSEGEGTTVSLSIPTKRRTREVGVQKAQPELEELKIEALRILVVDDEKANQVYSRELLKSMKLNPVIAENGEDALEKCHAESFDLILMDVSMPFMDGMQTTRAIRLLDGYAETAIVGLTAHNQKSIHQQCLEAGMNGSMLKPLTRDKIRGLIAGNFK